MAKVHPIITNLQTLRARAEQGEWALILPKGNFIRNVWLSARTGTDDPVETYVTNFVQGVDTRVHALSNAQYVAALHNGFPALVEHIVELERQVRILQREKVNAQ